MGISSKFTSRTYGRARKISVSITLVVVAIFLIVVGALLSLFVSGTKDYLPIDATIVEITSDEEVYVTYQIERRVYTEKINSYSSSYKVGNVLKLVYNPDNPSEIVDRPVAMSAIFIVLGIVILIYAVFKAVRDERKRKALEAVSHGEELPDERYAKYVSDVRIEDVLSGFKPSSADASEYNEYFFHYCGKLSQGHIMETPDRNPVYEARLVKFSLLGNSDYDFIDYKTGRTTPHLIGKTVTTNADGPFPDSGFKLDNSNIFDILQSSGYSVEWHVVNALMKMEYTLYYKGGRVGKMASAGTDVMPGVKSNKFTQNIVASGMYRVYCTEENIPIMFILALAFARSEVRVHE